MRWFSTGARRSSGYRRNAGKNRKNKKTTDAQKKQQTASWLMEKENQPSSPSNQPAFASVDTIIYQSISNKSETDSIQQESPLKKSKNYFFGSTEHLADLKVTHDTTNEEMLSPTGNYRSKNGRVALALAKHRYHSVDDLHYIEEDEENKDDSSMSDRQDSESMKTSSNDGESDLVGSDEKDEEKSKSLDKQGITKTKISGHRGIAQSFGGFDSKQDHQLAKRGEYLGSREDLTKLDKEDYLSAIATMPRRGRKVQTPLDYSNNKENFIRRMEKKNTRFGQPRVQLRSPKPQQEQFR